MNFFRRLLILIIAITICLAMYLWLPRLGYIEIVFLKYKVYIDLYLLIGILCIFCFVVNIFYKVVMGIKNFFNFSEGKHKTKSINGLAKYIVLNGTEDVDIEPCFEICKQALLVKNGLPIAHRTGIKEIDLYSIKAEIRNSLRENNLDRAIAIATRALREYTVDIAILQDELLQIATQAILFGKKFIFDPSLSKYKLTKEFVETYNIKTGLAEVSVNTDVKEKIKILEKLHKKYNKNYKISEQLLETLALTKSNETQILELLAETFGLRPNRNLVNIYLNVCTEPEKFEYAIRLLKDTADDNTEKNWFLLRVAIETRKYQKIIEYVTRLKGNVDNHMALCALYVDNYTVLSAEPEIIALLCK